MSKLKEMKVIVLDVYETLPMKLPHLTIDDVFEEETMKIIETQSPKELKIVILKISKISTYIT